MKFEVGHLVQIKEGMWREVDAAVYGFVKGHRYVVTAYKQTEYYPAISLAGYPNGWYDAAYFELATIKPKRYFIGDKVISTRDTPSVPEGFVGYVVERPSNSCNDYEYAVEHELSVGKIEYFKEDELELLSTSKQVSPDIARPILEERKIGKVQMNLFDEGFPNAVMEVAKVMTWAAENKGYKAHDWVNLPDAESSFPSAGSRHRVKSLIQKVSGLPVSECVDEESGILHKAHEAFNVLAELELILRGKIK